MIEEIIPAVKPLQSFKILAAEPEITCLLPGVDSKISFLPFINYLRQKHSSVIDSRSDFYKYLIKKFEAEPALQRPITDELELEKHAYLLELLCNSLFPVISEHEKNSFALAAPYQFRVFYYSDSFRKLFLDDKKQNLLLPEGLPAEKLKAIECSMIYDHILEKFYGIKLNDSPELIYPITDSQTGMKRFYRIRYDRRFIDIHLKGELPPIQDCAVCMNTFRILDLDKQLATMPFDLFEVEGFAVWVAEDVTTTECLETIKKILLRQDECDTGIINELKEAIHILIGLSEVQIGLMPFLKINDQFILDEECASHSLVGKTWRGNNREDIASFKKFLEFIHAMPQPMPVTNLSDQLFGFAPHMKPVYEQGNRSFIFYPMQNSDGLLGLLEIASPVPNLLTHEVMGRLEPAIPLLSVAMLKNRDTFNNKIEKLVKEKFTALQPSVEWKFSEVAWEYLRKNDSASETAKIVFENVYPLYGAIDIRNSSVERNHAIQKDLKEHLTLLHDTLDKLQSFLQLNLLEELSFKNQNLQTAISEVLLTEDEVRINEFLQNEVDSVFCHLQKSNIKAQPLIDNYYDLVNSSDSLLYHFRNEYEETLATINNEVLHYLEHEEEALQRSYPHYFEKYRTDGVEYNIYIGQSMAPEHPFDLLYLKNIRLWQLKSMAELVRITHRLLPSLKVPLQTTQLILIHNQQISISFRKDERRFDVEGSYNIRYEIMKKRIDKVRIKDTDERLTQPGMIAMVYGNPKEAQEYQEYIHFLQSKNLFAPGIELYELEELQGLKGLKAMRVKVIV